MMENALDKYIDDNSISVEDLAVAIEKLNFKKYDGDEEQQAKIIQTLKQSKEKKSIPKTMTLKKVKSAPKNIVKEKNPERQNMANDFWSILLKKGFDDSPTNQKEATDGKRKSKT